MPTFVIKNCPQHVYDQLKVAAKANWRTISEQAVFQLEMRFGSITNEPFKPAKLLNTLPEDFAARKTRKRLR